VKVRHSEQPVPRCFAGHPAGKGLLGECDIRLCGAGRLRAKLLVFNGPVALRRFWRDALGRNELGRHTAGAVSALSYERINVTTGASVMVVDPRYFCVIGLTRDNLSMEVITHEAVHAGFAYAKRVQKNLWAGADELDEENVCYPAGRIAAAINSFLHDQGLYR
jgi:hypothetical protein